MHKIHYLRSLAKSCCGKTNPVHVSFEIENITCKACLRSIWVLGKRARARLVKLCPPYARVPM
jgi:hypothetical protein